MLTKTELELKARIVKAVVGVVKNSPSGKLDPTQLGQTALLYLEASEKLQRVQTLAQLSPSLSHVPAEFSSRKLIRVLEFQRYNTTHDLSPISSPTRLIALIRGPQARSGLHLSISGCVRGIGQDKTPQTLQKMGGQVMQNHANFKVNLIYIMEV